MSKSILDRLKTILDEELNLPVNTENLNENTALDGDGLDLDSLGFVELIMQVEERFNFQFSETEINLENFKTIGSLSSLIASKLAENDHIES
jgi:acyl carrier protein